jgi:predicted glycogen debranching enzyme
VACGWEIVRPDRDFGSLRVGALGSAARGSEKSQHDLAGRQRSASRSDLTFEGDPAVHLEFVKSTTEAVDDNASRLDFGVHSGTHIDPPVHSMGRPRSAAGRSGPLTPEDYPVVLGKDVVGDFDSAVRREWLVTNGRGSYAFGTVAGVATRGYHGLLVAALEPPVGRTVLVRGLAEWASVGGERAALHAHEFADGTIEGRGYTRLRSFRLDGMIPVFAFAVGDTVIERRVWMAYGSDTTYVRYTVAGGEREVLLELTPIVTWHDHHALGHESDGTPDVSIVHGAPGPTMLVRAANEAAPVRIIAPGAAIGSVGRWLRGFRHREETARGLEDTSDAFAIGEIRITIGPGRPFTLILTTEPVLTVEPVESADVMEPELALRAEHDRQARLIRTAGAESGSPFLRGLVLAADQFLVARDIPVPEGGGVEHGRTVIAGYPWFNDWGRDTMIALPGLCLATGRHEEAATILRSFARFVRDGLLPNNFPDRAADAPEHHTIDASLWYPLAVRAHAIATGSGELVDELLPALRSILDAHLAGTSFGIGLDPADGLLRGGAEGYQLTWMDARVDGWVVTPRRGKPVEIQALWINALRIVGAWLVERRDAGETGAQYLAVAERAAASFLPRFWRPELGYLADVVDGPEGDEVALRPNQLLALSLPYPLVTDEQARAVVEVVGRELAVPLGLRSLAPSDPAYRPRFQGDRRFRDAGYHQGTVWTWLIGPYAEAVASVHGPAAGLEVLRPFEAHLRDAGLGSVSEVLEPEPPFDPRGCPAQAWGVAEVLRVWRALGGS